MAALRQRTCRLDRASRSLSAIADLPRNRWVTHKWRSYVSSAAIGRSVRWRGPWERPVGVRPSLPFGRRGTMWAGSQHRWTPPTAHGAPRRSTA